MILLLSLQYFEPNSSWYDTSMAQESKSKRNENSSASYTLRTHSSDFPADVSGSSESKPDCDNAITSLSGISCFRTNGWSAERIVSSLLSIVAIVMYLLADCLHPHSFYSPQVIFFCPLLIYWKTSHFLQLACWWTYCLPSYFSVLLVQRNTAEVTKFGSPFVEVVDLSSCRLLAGLRNLSNPIVLTLFVKIHSLT